MNKKMIIGIVGVMVLALIILGIVVVQNNKSEKSENNTLAINQEENMIPIDDENQVGAKNGNTLVVYFSAQSHTKAVAEKVASNLEADIFEIVPEDIYTSADLDWNDSNSRVSKEHNDESLRNVKLKDTKVENWEEYDRILIGYPIWWGIAAWPVDAFVKANNFSGKTVIPFCTSSSSGIGQSGELLKESANSGNWLEGYRFQSNTSDSDIATWTDSLK